MGRSLLHRPLGLRITARDIMILRNLRPLRTVTSEHVADLVFGGVARRTVQQRLRLLSAHGYLARRYFVSVATGNPESVRRLRMPVYILTRKGELTLDPNAVRTGKHAPKARTAEHLQHDLVAVDFLSACITATRSQSDVTVTAWQSENELRKKAAGLPRGCRVVPDAAVALRYPDGRVAAFCLEVVRAGVRSGNQLLARKLDRYRAAVRSGLLAGAVGGPVRAVIFAVPTDSRLQNLASLPRSGFAWLTAYERLPSAGPPVTYFTPDRILDLAFRDTAGRTFTLRAPWTPTPAP